MDIDWAPGASIALAMLPPTAFVYGRASNQVSHCWFTTPEPLLSLGLDEYKRRVTVYATYGPMPDGRRWMPRDRVRDAVDPAPTISADKAPDLIAKDIGRRFLPDYRKYLDLYRADVADATAFRAATSALFDDIVALGNGWIKPNTRNDERSTERTASLSDAPGINYGDLRVSGDSVRIEVSTTPEFAKRFAALLARTERQS